MEDVVLQEKAAFINSFMYCESISYLDGRICGPIEGHHLKIFEIRLCDQGSDNHERQANTKP